MKDGIPCPRCGGLLDSTVKTKPRRGWIQRRRECSVCGCRATSVERLHNAPPPSPGVISALVITDGIRQLHEMLETLDTVRSQLEAAQQQS